MTRPVGGFSLVELAVVMAIVALLIGGLLMPLSMQDEVRRGQETRKALYDVREALLGFAAVNGRLPCPAAGNLATGSDAAAGSEATSGTGAALACANAAGVLPWVTLGLPETDAWGRRYSYRVTPNFARGLTQTDFGSGCTPTPSAPANAAFALCSSGDMRVLNASGGTTIAQDLPAIAVSHGKQGQGAWLPSGQQIAGAAGDELENANGDEKFVGNGAIDDMPIWLSPSVLMSRMIVAGRLP